MPLQPYSIRQVGKSRQEVAEGKGIPHDEAMAKMRQHIETHAP